MTTDERPYGTESSGHDEIKVSEELTVIGRQEKGLTLPSITGFGVIERCEENGTPLKTELDSQTGNMNLVIDKRAFVRQVFNGLTIAGGEHKGELLSQDLIDAEIKRGRELLLREDLFEGETSEEYRQYQLNVSKMFTVADSKRKELKDPVTKINKAFQGLLEATLGDLIEIRAEVMVRTKEHKVEVEKRDREAKQADAALRESTDDEIRRVAYLALDARDSTADQLKEIAAELLASEFTPHESQAVAYVEAVAKASEALADMYQEKTKAEAAAALQKEEDDKKAAADKAELDKLRTEKADQKDKEDGAKYLADIQAEFVKCVEAPLKDILEAIDVAGIIDHQAMAVGNPHYDRESVNVIIEKMEGMRNNAKKQEDDKIAEAKVDADKIKQDAADKKAKEDKEKAETAAALEKANQELLLGAGFVLNGLSYEKGGIHLHVAEAKRSPSSDIGAFIVSTDKKIAVNGAAAKKAEDTRIKKEKEAKEKADQKEAARKEADRKSMALKVEEMTAGVKDIVERGNSHEEIIKAVVKELLEDGIPHVRFG